MNAICQNDSRRDAVRSLAGRNGLDYVEVADDQPALYVYFLGKLPPELSKNRPGLEQFLRVDGGERITGLGVLHVDPHVDPDPEHDDYLVVTLDQRGDLSTYTLRLIGVAGIDPHYDRAAFSFTIDCPSDLDCRPTGCAPAVLDEPRINYLAKDYASFRQLIFDRLALLVPGWRERHVPDLGVTLVEILAYVGDYLSYYQDAVATEAYLGTARQRISVRRHARLVDYQLHEGCNARAWVAITTSADHDLAVGEIAFVTGLNAAQSAQQTVVVSTDDLDRTPADSYEYFEPMLPDAASLLRLRVAHNEIRFYTWGSRECCLPRGTTSASLLDGWRADPAVESGWGRTLAIKPGDALIFEEIIGARTGIPPDADPRRRHVVRITSAQATEDPVYPIAVGEASAPDAPGGDAKQTDRYAGVKRATDDPPYRPTPVLEARWAPEDALPFPLCVSAIGAAPDCVYLTNISVARGNVILVDHGRTVEDPPFEPVPVVTGSGCCECEGEPADVTRKAGRYRPSLRQAPVTFCDPRPVASLPASRTLIQDVRAAIPAIIDLTDSTGATWTAACDLVSSGPDDRQFVAEIDNDGIARLRFGNGELGRAPSSGSTFEARYRVGCGVRGNAGADAIARIVLKNKLDGISLGVRNPLPAQGGTDPEPIAEAKLFAPRAFRKRLERAITADDYASLAERNPALQRAAAQLVWNGSWYEAEVAVDPLGGKPPDAALLDAITGCLHRYRRIGHDLHVGPALLIPLKLSLDVCARAGYDRGHVEAALLARFCSRWATTGMAFFDADNLSFGDPIYLSQIVAAAQAVTGVECATVTELRRLFEPANRELETGLLPLGAQEIAQLENDPNHPEHGQLTIVMRGGR